MPLSIKVSSKSVGFADFVKRLVNSGPLSVWDDDEVGESDPPGIEWFRHTASSSGKCIDDWFCSG